MIPRRWLLDDGPCPAVLAIAKPRVRRSTVIDSVTGQSKVDPIRTSEQTFLNRGHFDIVTTIEVGGGGRFLFHVVTRSAARRPCAEPASSFGAPGVLPRLARRRSFARRVVTAQSPALTA